MVKSFMKELCACVILREPHHLYALFAVVFHRKP